ncbi:hypothetical protein [Mesorhizobium sp. ES1-3]|nr:hypothetical protein [Mesorhizobium sp. ES1-3]
MKKHTPDLAWHFLLAKACRQQVRFTRLSKVGLLSPARGFFK